MPQGPAKFDLLTAVRDGLMSQGYADIGIDHFAREDDELAIWKNITENRISRRAGNCT